MKLSLYQSFRILSPSQNQNNRTAAAAVILYRPPNKAVQYWLSVFGINASWQKQVQSVLFFFIWPGLWDSWGEQKGEEAGQWNSPACCFWYRSNCAVPKPDYPFPLILISLCRLVLPSLSGPKASERLNIRSKSESMCVRHRAPPPATLICYFYFLAQAVKLEAGVNI